MQRAVPLALVVIATSAQVPRASAQPRTVPTNPFQDAARSEHHDGAAAHHGDARPEDRRDAVASTESETDATVAPAPATDATVTPEPATEGTARANEVASSSPARAPAEIEQLAAEATDAEHPPPPPDEAMGALDEVIGDAPDPIAGVEHETVEPAQGDAGLPTRAEMAAAIAEITPSVRACARGQTGETIELRIVFTSSGRVTTATVGAEQSHLSPAQRSCVARAVRRAQVSAFARPRIEVSYPVRL